MIVGQFQCNSSAISEQLSTGTSHCFGFSTMQIRDRWRHWSFFLTGCLRMLRHLKGFFEYVFHKKKMPAAEFIPSKGLHKKMKAPHFHNYYHLSLSLSLSLSPLLSFFFNKNNLKKKYAKNVRLNFLSFPLWNWNDLKWKVAVACAGWPPTWSHRWRWRRHVKLLLRPPRDSPSQLADMFQHVLVKSSG